MIKNTKDRLQLRPAMSTFFAATKEDVHVDIIDLTANFVSFSGTCVYIYYNQATDVKTSLFVLSQVGSDGTCRYSVE
jgi:hypothetical protein